MSTFYVLFNDAKDVKQTSNKEFHFINLLQIWSKKKKTWHIPLSLLALCPVHFLSRPLVLHMLLQLLSWPQVNPS